MDTYELPIQIFDVKLLIQLVDRLDLFVVVF